MWRTAKGIWSLEVEALNSANLVRTGIGEMEAR